MGWPKYKTPENYPADKLQKLLKEREENIIKIREMLDNESY
jgi:hypothetical protein